MAPYATFGTPELADHVRAALTDRTAALMANHGSVAIGKTLDQAVEDAYLLEWLAALHHRARRSARRGSSTRDEQTAVVMAAIVAQLRTLGGPVMKIATVGVHVLDTHVVGIESIPAGSDGQLVETIRMSPAGTAGGTAVVLSRLGAEALSFGAVGTDPIGDALLGLLAREGVDVAGLVRKAAPQTSASVIPVRPNGDRPAWHCIGANGAFTLDDLPLDALAGITHLHLGGPEFLGGEAAGRLLAHARSIGATTSLDILAPGDPELLTWIADALPHTDYLLPNDDQVLGFTGAASLVEGARALVAAGAGCVAVTQGARGALVVTADETIEVPAYDVRGRRHDRVRRRVLGRLPARAGPRPRPAGRRRARLCRRGSRRPGPRHRRGLVQPGVGAGARRRHRNPLSACAFSSLFSRWG